MTTPTPTPAAPRSAGLQFIQPLEVSFEIDGVPVTCSPLVLREMPQFLELALPVFAHLPIADPTFFGRMRRGELSDDEAGALLTAFVVSGGEMIQMLAFCCRQPADWVGGLLIDRATEMLAVAMEVNFAFFLRALPMLKAMGVRARIASEVADAAPAAVAPAPAGPVAPASTTPTPSSSS